MGAFADDVCSKGVAFGEKLELTETQYRKLAGLQFEYRKVLVDTLAKADDNYQELIAVLSTYPVDREAALACFDKAAALSQELNATYLRLCLKAEKVFTEEQMEVFRGLLEKEDRILGRTTPWKTEDKPTPRSPQKRDEDKEKQ